MVISEDYTFRNTLSFPSPFPPSPSLIQPSPCPFTSCIFCFVLQYSIPLLGHLGEITVGASAPSRADSSYNHENTATFHTHLSTPVTTRLSQKNAEGTVQYEQSVCHFGQIEDVHAKTPNCCCCCCCCCCLGRGEVVGYHHRSTGGLPATEARVRKKVQRRTK